MFSVPDGDDSVHLLNKLLLLIIIEIHVPFRKPSLTRSVLDQNKANLKKNVHKLFSSQRSWLAMYVLLRILSLYHFVLFRFYQFFDNFVGVVAGWLTPPFLFFLTGLTVFLDCFLRDDFDINKILIV